MRSLRSIYSVLVATSALAVPGLASAPEAAPPADIVVTGFRESLTSAINIRRNATSFIDAIKAEDIAEFPDLNLAESLQRIPGVAITRVNGEGPAFRCAALVPNIPACGSTGWKRSAPAAAPTNRAASIAGAGSTSTSSRPTCSTIWR